MRITLINAMLLATVLVSNIADATQQKVEVVYSKQEANHQELELSGNVQAFNDAHLTSLEPGVVKTIMVDAGDHIKAGQVLLKLDDSLAAIELEQAKAAHLSAEVRYQEDQRLLNEVVDLAKKQVVPTTLLAERKANVAISQAMLAKAKAELTLQQKIVERHTLVAPFSGIIAQRNIDVGEWVGQQDKVLQLVSDDSLRLFVDVPQEYLTVVKNSNGLKVLVIPDSDPSRVLELSLSQFIAVSNPVSRTLVARIDLPKNAALVSGMSARARIILPSQGAHQVTLPKSSLKRHPDGSYSVYAVVNNKVERFSVKVLDTQLEQVTVQGVPDNTAIIVSGSDLLIEGSAVTISQSKE